jgi:hypothetical protein
VILHSALGKTCILSHACNRRLGVAYVSEQVNRCLANAVASASAFELLQSLLNGHDIPLCEIKNYHKKTLWLAFYSASFVSHWGVFCRKAIGGGIIYACLGIKTGYPI